VVNLLLLIGMHITAFHNAAVCLHNDIVLVSAVLLARTHSYKRLRCTSYPFETEYVVQCLISAVPQSTSPIAYSSYACPSLGPQDNAHRAVCAMRATSQHAELRDL
jgi:hypothetical protein